MRIGFIGLGMMGRPMARRLLAEGHQVTVHNRSRRVIDELAAEGAVPATSVAEVTKDAELVLTALPSIDSVRQVYSEMARTASPGQLFIDHSTVDIETSRWCGSLMPAFLDAPVSGPPPVDSSTRVTVMAGGDAANFERALPAFKAYGGLIRLCGPLGAGTAVKLVNQLLGGVNTAAAAEAAAFGARLGADPHVLFEVISASLGASRMWERHMPRFITHDFSNPTPVRLLLKDLGIVAAAGGELPLSSLARELFERMAAQDGGDQDISAVIRQFEDE